MSAIFQIIVLFFHDGNMKAMFPLGVFGIIRDNDGRILLCLRNDYNLRNLPGGGVET